VKADSRDFLAFVDDDGRLGVSDRTGFRAYLRQFAGKNVIVSVNEPSKKRSLAQNRWLWGQALPLIAEHCGYDRHEHERLHYDLLSVRFGTTAVAPLITGAPPRIVPTRTSSELTTAEFSDYMDWLTRYAAETFDVILPLPDESRVA